MLSRLLPKPYHFRGAFHLLLPSKLQSFPLCNTSSFISPLRRLSTNNDDNNNQNDSFWKLPDSKYDPFFAAGSDSPSGAGGEESWLMEEGSGSSGPWETAAEAHKAWSLDEEEEGKKADELFDLGDVAGGIGDDGNGIGGVEDAQRKVEMEALAEEEKALVSVLKGPNRAFGDLLAASGITDAMLHSLIALKDFEDVAGLPPLSEIEEMRYQKGTRRSIRAEMERQKQEEAAKARVRKVDEKGRAYGTGRRKCSIARVWIEPGEGKFLVNDKEFDVYFPMLDHRAALLQPFSETKTLGLWNVNCTVKGGGVSGQVGAIQLGVSRALQNWEPDLRPPLRSGGFLTRDSRVVERKKPGKAKARKSFQWVKR